MITPTSREALFLRAQGTGARCRAASKSPLIVSRKGKEKEYMSAVKEIGARRRYLLPVLVLLLALVALAKLPMSDASSASVAGAAGTAQGKAGGPQAAMPSSGALSAGSVAASSDVVDAGRPVIGHSIKNDVSPPLRDIPNAPYQASKEAPENPQLPIAHSSKQVKDPV